MVQLSNSLSVRKELRTCIVDTLNELMKKNHNIVALENKFESFSNWVDLKNEHPKRYLNMPVDEENMVGIAAGLSLAGYQPFIHLFDSHAIRKILINYLFPKDTVEIPSIFLGNISLLIEMERNASMN